MNNSLRLRLELWLLVPLTLLAAFDTWGAIRDAEETARIVQERLLIGAARMFGEQVHLDEGVLQAEVPPAAFELFVAPPYRDSVYYRIETADHRLLSGNVSLLPPDHALAQGEVVYFDTAHRERPAYAVALGQPVFNGQAVETVTVVVAQTTDGRDALARQLWQRAVAGHVALLLVAAALLWWGLRQGLRPLVRLQQQVAQRQPGALSRLDDDGVPQELRPLVQVVNDYVQRLDAHVSAQERFISNAAHQLRTPLALLGTQIAYARRTQGEAELREVVVALDAGIQHAARLVQQLLSMDLVHTQLGQAREPVNVDLTAVARRVLEAQVIAAERIGVDLGMEGGDQTVWVPGDPLLLHELVSNLVDNAIRYSGAGGRVTLCVQALPAVTELLVMDNGPGIPDAEKPKVFQRFYRVHNSNSDGSGLGLAIVKEIADGMGATVQLEDAQPGPGLWVRVRWTSGKH